MPETLKEGVQLATLRSFSNFRFYMYFTGAHGGVDEACKTAGGAWKPFGLSEYGQEVGFEGEMKGLYLGDTKYTNKVKGASQWVRLSSE